MINVNNLITIRIECLNMAANTGGHCRTFKIRNDMRFLIIQNSIKVKKLKTVIIVVKNDIG